MFRQKHSININGQVFTLDKALVMGILNLTPDSFFDGGKYFTETEIKTRIQQMIAEGVDIIDIGGMSSRPGSDEISIETEWERLEKGLHCIREIDANIPISVDTYRSKIARKSVENFNAGMINDISGGTFDPEMPNLVAELNCPYVLMHMPQKPKTMQRDPLDKNALKAVMDFFYRRLYEFQQAGAHDIIIDPGFGFGKTVEANYMLLNYLERFHIFDRPLLCGFSRKSMIYKQLNTTPAESLNGTTVLNSIALSKGCQILRVHDVKAAKEAVFLSEFTKSQVNQDW
ncbi:MAG: dihydropteroate synthase [Bacteroidales bacterium]|jgi:dihydropteroate synthase|nr:dihydropteroate synthase [Bacteroidales bacterium]